MSSLGISFGVFDVLLFVVVSVQATVVAYLKDPESKAFMLTLPIPFTVAVLAVGQPVNTFNVAALVLLLIFTNAVRILHYTFKISIIAAIVSSAFIYCLLSISLTKLIPSTYKTFWPACLITGTIAAFVYLKTPHRIELAYSSGLPIFLKLPFIMCIVFILICMKQFLMGFVTLFPMVGVFAAYEARFSLWTVCKQIPIVMITILAMLIACYLAQPGFGIAGSLIIGWIVFLVVLALQHIVRGGRDSTVKMTG